MGKEDSLSLSNFFPESIQIIEQSAIGNMVFLRAKSKTHEAICPSCGERSRAYHSTYRRHLQDLPMLGKAVRLEVTAYRYYCGNASCGQKVFCEELDGFAGNRRRMTDRLEAFIITLALETNCESTAWICSHLGVSISGDTVIRMLLRRAESGETNCSSMIGVDDWAYKKGHSYGTIICDGETHKPIALLDGRDGRELKEWLRRNQQVKVVTRDRAGAYANAISEVLPNAIQVADRFHLYQNISKAVKDVIGRELPHTIVLKETPTSLDEAKSRVCDVKKTN